MSNYIDSDNPFGCRQITIGLVTYDAENWDYSETARVLEITDFEDKPKGQISRRGFPQGSATLHLDGGKTVPAVHTEFEPAEGTMFITEVGTPETKDGIQMVRIGFRKKLTA